MSENTGCAVTGAYDKQEAGGRVLHEPTMRIKELRDDRVHARMALVRELFGLAVEDAREDDALTLWHLLSRVSDADRPRVYDRLAALAPPPAGVTREGILHLDRQMLDSWWNSLGYGDVGLWRMYEHDWSKRTLGAK